ncbi:hypothetical protein EW146_g9645, partial [Bondarzewia mesenterica]
LAAAELNDEPRNWAAAQTSSDADKWCTVYLDELASIFAKGFTQIPGQDFMDTFSPITRLESQCLLLHLAVHFGWPIEQLDIKTAFLYGDLTEDLWME